MLMTYEHLPQVRPLLRNSSTRSNYSVVQKKHHLKLNVNKCEIVVFANGPSGAENLPVCDVDGVVVPSGNVGKCLGYWWKGDLLSSKSIEEKHQQSFGSIGVFCGDISPLSSRSVLERSVMPILYGSENWILREPLEEGRVVPGRAGKMNPEMAKTAAMTCLDLLSMCFRMLVSKLGFL